jgi:Na+/melibiose symporter-like transporter
MNQSSETLLGIRLIFCIVPVLFTGLGMIFIALYPISHKKYQEIVAELERRRAAQP